jgi:hypothetical protein
MAKDSAYTSTRQIPACFNAFELGPINLDIGGGRYDDGTNYLADHKVTNLVLDQFNRSKVHNDEVLAQVKSNGVDTITVLNVLNVINDRKERDALYSDVCYYSAINNHAPVIFQVYEGNRTGVRDTGKTVQNNMKTLDYMGEIERWFSVSHNVTRWKNFIIVESKNAK